MPRYRIILLYINNISNFLSTFKTPTRMKKKKMYFQIGQITATHIIKTCWLALQNKDRVN